MTTPIIAQAELDELRALTENAMLGPWIADEGSDVDFCSHTICQDTHSVTESVVAHIVSRHGSNATAKYIATAHPTVMRILLDLIAKQRDILEFYSKRRHYPVSCPLLAEICRDVGNKARAALALVKPND